MKSSLSPSENARALARWILFLSAAVLLAVPGCDSGSEDPVADVAADMEEDTSTTTTEEDTAEPDVEEDTVNPFADSDNDGLADYLEDKNGNLELDPGETDPNNADTDNDGLVDGLEDANQNGRADIGETDPLDDDTDDDGLLDGLEDANANGMHDADDGETSPLAADTDDDGLSDLVEVESEIGLDPNNADTDLDGIPDGTEDADKSGTYDPEFGETNPTDDDTDADGQSDGCEDRNTNGMVDLGETDPRRADSDGDGLVDGIECVPLPAGACPNYDNVGNCATDPTKADTDGDGLSDLVELRSDYGGGISTDPRKADTDGDGVPDGIEDFNQNGSYDPQLSELNPIEPETDGSTPDALRPQAQACLSDDLPTIVENQSGDYRFAFATEMFPTELSFGVGATNITGFAIDNAGNDAVAAFVISKPAAAGVTTADEQQTIDGTAIGGSSFFPRTFETWDLRDAATTTYRIAKSDTVGGLRNEVLAKVTGVSEGAIGNLPVAAGASASNFEVLVTTVYRDSGNVIVIAAVIPENAPDAAHARGLSISNATGLASFGDSINSTEDGMPLKACNIFRVTELPIVDFLFVIDDSGSMGPYQDALSISTQSLFGAVQSAFISARWTINSTEAGDDAGSVDGGPTHCGLLSKPQGQNGNIWAPFTGAFEASFECKVRDPAGAESSCPANPSTFWGGSEYGLVCSKWAIDYFQGRRGSFDPTHLQRPRSELIVIVITDEDEDLTNGTSGIASNEAVALQNFVGGPLNGANVGAAFSEFFQTAASAPPYGRATPFFIYSSSSSFDRDGYWHMLDGNPDPTAFPNSASLDIGSDAIATEIGVFVDRVIRAANGLASTFEPLNVPITANMKVVVQRAFTTDAITLVQSQDNGWNYDPVANSMLFFGPDRPVLLDSFAINYAFWVPGPTP